MAVSSFVEVFAKPTTAAPVLYTKTSLPFAPKAILLFSAGVTAQDTFGTLTRVGVGFATAAAAGCSGIFGSTLASNADVARRIAAKGISFPDNAGASVAECSVSLTSDGYVLTFNPNDAVARLVNVLAIGGSDITDVEIVEWIAPTSVGTGTTDIAFSFTPEWFLVVGVNNAASPSGSANARFSFGMGCAPGGSVKQYALSISETDNAAATDTARQQETNACFLMVNSDASLRLKLSLNSFQTNAIRVNNDTVDALSWRFYILAGRGGQVDIHTETKPTGAAPATLSTTQPFAAVAAFFASNMHTATGAGVHSRGTFGATDGTTRVVAAWSDSDNVSAAAVGTRVLQSADSVLEEFNNNTPTEESDGDVTAIDADSIDLSFDPNSSAALLFSVMTWGSVAAGGDAVPQAWAQYRARRV